jgi:hypothetical protein
LVWENSKTAIASWIDGLGLSTLSLSLVAVLTATLILLVVLRVLKVVFRRLLAGLDRWEETRLRPLRFQQQEILSAEDIAQLLQGALRAVRLFALLLLFSIYFTVVVAIFPFTQMVAIGLIDQIVAGLRLVGTALVGYLPELVQILIYIVLARYLIRLAQLVFNGIESKRIKIRGFFPDWASPTSTPTSRTLFTRPESRSPRPTTPPFGTVTAPPSPMKTCRRTTRYPPSVSIPWKSSYRRGENRESGQP